MKRNKSDAGTKSETLKGPTGAGHGRSQHVGKMRLMLEYEREKAIYCNFARLAIMYASRFA